MDTAIIVSVIIGSVVAMVLVFGKTVLGVAWTGKNSSKLGIIGINSQYNSTQSHAVNTNTNNSEVGFNTILRDQELKLKNTAKNGGSNNFDSLKNKQAYTCDNIVIGNIRDIYNGMLIIVNSISQGNRYEIPVYYTRQIYQNTLVVDISAKDLEHYIPQIIMGKQK